MQKTKRLTALLLSIIFTLSLLGTMTASSAEDLTVNVAYFSVDDASATQINGVITEWFNNNTVTADNKIISGAKFTKLTAAQIADGALDGYDVLIIGDSCSASINMGKTVMNALDAAAVTAIQTFVASGKGYLGIGGGAFAATHTFTSVGDTNKFIGLINYKLDYPNWNHGTGELVVVPSTVSHTVTKGMESGKKYMAFADAPPVLLSGTSSDSRMGVPQMLLKYFSNPRNNLGATVNVNSNAYKKMDGTPAMAAATFGSGRVVISGLLLQSAQSVNMGFLMGRSLLYCSNYNNVTAVEKSAERTQFDVVGEWIWSSEVYSRGANGAKQIIARSKELGVTDVYLLVKGGVGKVAYSKGSVPLAREYSNRDILQEVITAAHAVGIRVHAWISTLSDSTYAETHIQETLYHYKRGYANKEAGNDWNTLDPTLPNYASYMKNLIAELARNYDIDGIHLDYVRYTHTTYGWSEANIRQMEQYGINVATLRSYIDNTYYSQVDDGYIYRQHASGYYYSPQGIDALRYAQMRCDNIKNFAKGIIDSARSVKSDLTISAALMPEGAYQGNQYVSGNNNYPSSSSSYGEIMFGQSYEHSAELFDYVCPMAYTDTYTASAQWIAALASSAAAKGNKVVMGLQCFTPGDGDDTVTSVTMMNEIEQLRKIASSNGVLGFVMFRQGLYAYANSTYSASQNLLKVKLINGFSNSTLGKVVITMQDGMKATGIAGYDNFTGVSAAISDGGRTVTLSKSSLIAANSEAAVYINVSGALNKTLGPCFVDVYGTSDNRTRAYQTYTEGSVTPPAAPTPLPTLPNASNFTMQQVLSAMTSINETSIANNGSMPNSTTINSTTVSKASYFRLACAALYNANISAPRTALVSCVTCKTPTGSQNNTFNDTSISRDAYLYVMQRQLAFIDSNSYMPAGYVTFPGESGLSYKGQFNYENALRVFVRALAFYDKYGVLPELLSVEPVASFTPTPAVPTPTLKVTPTPTSTPTPKVTPTPTSTPTPKVTPTPTPTPTSNVTPTPTPTPTSNVTPTPTPTITPTPTVTPAQQGDVNGDGNVNSRDIAAVQRHIIGTDTLTGMAFAAADINGDGNVNSRDIAAIQRKLLQ